MNRTPALISLEHDCRSCYKCIRHCPTKAISFENNQAKIINNECIYCGMCYLVCPQMCKEIRCDYFKVKEMIANGDKVIASVAPSFIACFPGCSFNTFKDALLKLGFYDAEETAIGATIVKKQYDDLVNKGDKDVYLSTCCHAINVLVQKYYPDLIDCLCPVLSPMLAHAKDIKERYDDDVKIIFIGPCIAKKDEADYYQGYDDEVLTFIELENWLQEENIEIEISENKKDIDESLARLFPIEGGILATMKKNNPEYNYVSISGADNVKEVLEEIQSGMIHKCFIEVSSCIGSCVNGPAVNTQCRSIVSGVLNVRSSAGSKDFITNKYSLDDTKQNFITRTVDNAIPSDEEITKILNKIGKYTKEDELNCACCGYPTCRDKAIAVYQNKANLEMCLPYLTKRATNFTDEIVDTTSNGVIVVDDSLNIQLLNKKISKFYDVKVDEFIGKPLETLMEPTLFSLAMSGLKIKDKKIYVEKTDIYLEATIKYKAEYGIVIAILRDITSYEKRRLNNLEIARQTSEITEGVIEQSMRTVQEIAALLGETTASTKVALNNLKNAIIDSQEKDDE